MLRLLAGLRAAEAGEAAISYCLIAGLISVAAIVAMTQLGHTLPHLFELVTTALHDGLARIGL